MASSTIVNNVFAKLLATYPVFDDLKAYLTTLGIKTNTTPDDPLVLFRYNRESCDLTNPIVRAFRSVVWDSLTNRPVFVAPQKSEDMTTFQDDFVKLIVEEFVDGVMVNLFMDPYKKTWRMTTRSCLDADNKFYQHTFASLFASSWTTLFPDPATGYAELNPAWGYSFVMQHPYNRIVVPVEKPSLTLVEISALDQQGHIMRQPQFSQTALLAPPRRFAVTSMAECQLLLTNMEQFEGFRAQGVVIRNITTGQRWKIRTNAYTACRKLRGNHSQLEYVWFDNLKNGTLSHYLSYYPEEVQGAHAALANWNKVVSDIYNWYVHVFKMRDTPKEHIPGHLKGILFDLHGQYISRLAKEKKSLDWNEHQLIMGRQDLKRIVFLATFKDGAAPPPSFQKRQKSNTKKEAAAAASSMVA